MCFQQYLSNNFDNNWAFILVLKLIKTSCPYGWSFDFIDCYYQIKLRKKESRFDFIFRFMCLFYRIIYFVLFNKINEKTLNNLE